MRKKTRSNLYFAWLIAFLASLGSLYISDVLLFPACLLCWYQRICLYPLSVILFIACWRGSASVIPYVIPQVIVGLGIALYQVVIQEIPALEPLGLCGNGPNCSEKLAIGLGPITLPMLSVVATGLILFLLLNSWKKSKVIV